MIKISISSDDSFNKMIGFIGKRFKGLFDGFIFTFFKTLGLLLNFFNSFAGLIINFPFGEISSSLGKDKIFRFLIPLHSHP